MNENDFNTGKYLPRWQMLSNFKNKLCQTKWLSRNDSILSIKINFTDILKRLSTISLGIKKQKENHQALCVQKKLKNFDFVSMLCFHSKNMKNLI